MKSQGADKTSIIHEGDSRATAGGRVQARI